MSKNTTELTGYPSIDKPWLKYYNEEAIINPIPNCSVYDYMYQQNKDNQDVYAINYLGTKITYKELFTNIDCATNAYAGLGVKAGDMVMMFALNIPEVVYSIYALNRLGAIVDLEYVTLKTNEIKNAIDKTEAQIVITIETFLPKIIDSVKDNPAVKKVVVLSVGDSLPVVKHIFYGIKNKAAIPDNDKYISYKDLIKNTKIIYDKNNGKQNIIPLSGDKTSFILHTGGSTGVPKGVKITNSNLNSIAFQYGYTHVDFHNGDRMMNIAPVFLAFGLGLAIHAPLCLRLCICLSPDPNPYVTGKMFAYYRPNHLLQGPSYIKAMLGNKKIQKMDLSFVYTIVCGGEGMTMTLEEEINDFLRKRGSDVEIIAGYGMTECCGTVVTGQGKIWKKGSVGIPFPRVSIKVVDVETQEELKCGQEGEILISSPSLMSGYTDCDQNEQNTIYTDKDGCRWIHSGDIGCVDRDGFVFIKGRIKRIYLVKWQDSVYKMFPGHIESVISQMEEVKTCAVIAKEIEEKEYKPYAFVQLKENAKLSKDDILSYCNDNLAGYEVPDKITFLDTIPLTSAGKVDYLKLEKTIDRV